MRVGTSGSFTVTLTLLNPEPFILPHIGLADYQYDEESGMYWADYSDGTRQLTSEEELIEFISTYNKKIDSWNENLRRHAEEINELEERTRA